MRPLFAPPAPLGEVEVHLEDLLTVLLLNLGGHDMQSCVKKSTISLLTKTYFGIS